MKAHKYLTTTSTVNIIIFVNINNTNFIRMRTLSDGVATTFAIVENRYDIEYYIFGSMLGSYKTRPWWW